MRRAVSALLAAEQVSQTILPPIGGALFALVGPLPALAANALTYLASQASLVAIDTLGPQAPSGLPTLAEIVADVAIGFRFMWRDVTMRTLSLLSLSFNFFGLMTGAAFIPFLKRDFGASDAVVGYALGIGAVGAFVGSALAGRIPAAWPFGRVMIVAYALDGILFIPVMFTHQLGVAIAFLALTNGCVLFEIAQIVGWRMRVTPEEQVGRVFGAVRLVVLIGTVPGALLGGALADRYGARFPIQFSGYGYLAMTLAFAVFPPSGAKGASPSVNDEHDNKLCVQHALEVGFVIIDNPIANTVGQPYKLQSDRSIGRRRLGFRSQELAVAGVEAAQWSRTCC